MTSVQNKGLDCDLNYIPIPLPDIPVWALTLGIEHARTWALQAQYFPSSASGQWVGRALDLPPVFQPVKMTWSGLIICLWYRPATNFYPLEQQFFSLECSSNGEVRHCPFLWTVFLAQSCPRLTGHFCWKESIDNVLEKQTCGSNLLRFKSKIHPMQKTHLRPMHCLSPVLRPCGGCLHWGEFIPKWIRSSMLLNYSLSRSMTLLDHRTCHNESHPVCI